MSQDLYGCALSTSHREVMEHINSFSIELLRMGKKLDGIIEAVRIYPQEAFLHILAAIFYLHGQTSENQAKAKQHLQEASPLLNFANEREQSLYQTAEYWSDQSLSEALKHIERHCFKWPQDLTAIKIAEFLFYCKGQKYESKRFLRLTSHCHSEHKDNPYFLAIHSFALELSGRLDDSLQTAQKALQLNEKNPWAHHTLSHIFLKSGQDTSRKRKIFCTL
jgi:tetratricopeptide (TPR) repeat protein